MTTTTNSQLVVLDTAAAPLALHRETTPDLIQVLGAAERAADSSFRFFRGSFARETGVKPIEDIEELIAWSLREEHYDPEANERIERESWGG